MDDERRTRGSYRRLPSGQRRDQIIAAAIATFSENPDASLGEVAAAAGISRTSLYRFFETRQDLLHAAFRLAGSRLVSQVNDVPRGSPSTVLVTGLHNFFEFVEQYDTAYVAFMQWGSPLATQEIRDAAQQVRDQIGRFVCQALRVTEVTPLLDITVRTWVAGVENAALHWLRERHPSRGEIQLIVATNLGTMLFNAAAYDPAIAERIDWWLRAESPDTPMAAHLRSLAGMCTVPIVANVTRLILREGRPAPGG
ncbi:TetR/AcrR family transcriptional regulator [Actinomadura craniellae]|uniref:TetR/AcrR family transcriptional regulator n=1 Tax=Actinomadura craniellae TaxID=2231787 RepID=A0A365GZM4_9ACTN|nr:TetR/AcrR family transcriptional regulator [Actinomadura craniellae]RAY12246.1 TetR/AcrR family transcriptional regulator [Actinomadura craniellae]